MYIQKAKSVDLLETEFFAPDIKQTTFLCINFYEIWHTNSAAILNPIASYVHKI